MARKPAYKVRDDYPGYESLLNDRKQTEVYSIRLTDVKKSRPTQAYHQSKVQHERFDDILLMVGQERKTPQVYRFQLMCKTMDDEPCFRFESDGSSHKNRHLPLSHPEHSVPTPHFNRFDSNGACIAYQLPALKAISDSGDMTPLDNMPLFFRLFCDECNLRHKEDMYPSIHPCNEGEFSFEEPLRDPVSHVNFKP